VFDWSGIQDVGQMYSTYTVGDGLGIWDDAWPAGGSTNPISGAYAQQFMSARGSKSFLMPISTFQYKHNQWGNWVRNGEMTLPLRIQQVVDIKPQFVEILTWNDEGEGHYVGQPWPDSNPVPGQTLSYDHTPWLELYAAMIRSYKYGVPLGPAPGNQVQGAFWYRQIFKYYQCNDPAGPPANLGASSDSLNVALVLSQAATVTVRSGGSTTSFQGQPGLNHWQVPLGVGVQSVTVGSYTSTGGKVVYGDCSGTGQVYNFNYQVVGVQSGSIGGQRTADEPGTSGGLSGGAIAGIVVGCVAAAVLVVVAVALLISRSNKQEIERF